jgi:FkbM family methyltransferase
MNPSRVCQYIRKTIISFVIVSTAFYIWHNTQTNSIGFSEIGVSSSVKLVNFSASTTENFTCIRTKKLLTLVQTTLCVHHDSDFLTVVLNKDKIYEEWEITILLRILLRDPHLALIDVGANVGLYSMYAASLGRFVLAIECFPPNIERMRKAVQHENIQNNVVLVSNAVYTESGRYFRLLKDNHSIGAQVLDVNHILDRREHDIYTVQTIKFDEILPIIKQRNVQKALLKVDIESSESFVFQSGSEVFRSVDIPFIMIEWTNVKKIKDRADFILNFLTIRRYVPTYDGCRTLNFTNPLLWPDNIMWIQDSYTSEFCNMEGQV